MTTAAEAIELLETGRVQELSLDHDLSDDELYGRGIDVVDYLVEQQELHGRVVWPSSITLHTANPAGRDQMARAIRRYAPRTCEVEETLTRGAKIRFLVRPKRRGRSSDG